MKRLYVLIMIILMCFAAGGAAFAQEKRYYEQEQAQEKTVVIPKVSRAPKFEDFITGAPREAELVITDFRQMDPGDGDPVSQQTAAYLSYDDKNLYAAFVCKDDPSKIRATIGRRDTFSGDDGVTISLDTFQDLHRNYFFSSNPYGVQMDAMVNNGMEDYNFDTLWYSEGRIVDDGYIVLMTIPFKSMRFPNTPVQTWGILLTRGIMRNNEWSNWPYLTWRLMPSWGGQFGIITGLENISPGRNMQFIPYAGFSRASYWNPMKPGLEYDTKNDFRAGLDAKMVLRDALTLDLTVNPDFSHVESDSPQVTINQRYEISFSEKRPFFMENADYFSTSENLFFSRRIIDPQFGARLTGKIGRWGVGVLAGDDRAPGERVPEDSKYFGDRAVVGVFRLYRDIGRESRIGGLFTSRDFAGSSNRVYSLDTRLTLSRNVTLTGQLIGSSSSPEEGETRNGGAGYLRIAQSGRHFTANAYYSDRSPAFETDMGFITRVDMRETGGSVGYTLRPGKGNVLSYGPSFSGSVIYDYDGTLTDWSVSPSFSIEMPKYTTLSFARTESFEHFAGLDFRKNSNRVSISSQWQKWLHLSSRMEYGDRINYYPTAGMQPFLAKSLDTNFGMTLIPAPQLQIEETYLFTRLAADGRGTVFNNHIWRTKANYQFTREFSLRAIVDYNAVLPNDALVGLERSKRLGLDVLFTYMLHPGTALYIGYTDNYENLRFDPVVSPLVQRGSFPDTYVSRQIFAKFSYLIRV